MSHLLSVDLFIVIGATALVFALRLFRENRRSDGSRWLLAATITLLAAAFEFPPAATYLINHFQPSKIVLAKRAADVVAFLLYAYAIYKQ